MTRAVGILVGALLMLAVFLLVFGAGITPSPLSVVVNHDTGVLDGPDLAEVVTAEQPEISPTDASSDDEKARLSVDDDGIQITPQSWNQSMASDETADRKEAVSVSRYLVWSPFRSEWAAQGFARRLTLATAVPVEVINEGPENYQVIFRYRDEDERQALVTQIEHVTGLELE